ncbi:transcription termination factor Rho [bacterium]|nr:transcription termination factor Rho [candidate division CSSED10-310 bacterium]
MSNTMTYDDLLKLPVTKLREIALTLEVIQGVHGMNKEQVMQAICSVKGIENPYKKEAEKRKAEARANIIEMKAQRKTLRAELAEKKTDMSKDEKKVFRKKIKKLRRETRRLADV